MESGEGECGERDETGCAVRCAMIFATSDVIPFTSLSLPNLLLKTVHPISSQKAFGLGIIQQ